MRYSPFRHIPAIFSTKKPVQLTLFVTNRCNAHCPFCFYTSEKKARPRREDLSVREIKKISASMGKLLWLAFSGGEIFLRPDICEITDVFYRQNKPAIILLPTNGLLTDKIASATEDILKNCPKSVVTIKLSIDGPPEIHDSLRGVPGAFTKVMHTYKRLHPLLQKYPNFELGVNTVFCAANQDHMPETIELAAQLANIKTHTISLIRGTMADAGQKEVDMEKYRRATSLLDASNHKSKTRYSFIGGRLKATQDILQRRLIYQTASQERQQLPCQAGRLTAVITENGDVYPCESFTNKLGNVRDCDYDLQRIMACEKSIGKLAKIKESGCFCTHECYMMMNILFSPSQYPALLREFVRGG